MYLLGSGFAVHKSLVPHIREFKLVWERILMLRSDTKPINTSIIHVYAPTEVSDAHMKDLFYEELTKIYEEIPNYTIKMVLGDLNAKCGKEVQFIPTIGKESLYDHRNDNGLRVISFATSNETIINSTIFPHKGIHKATWQSPNSKICNQIDHVLIQKRYRRSIFDVRSYREAGCEVDHFLVIVKFKCQK